MTRFDALIFDLDGTLWDTSAACAQAWNNVVARHAIDFRQIVPDDVRRVTGRPHDECIETVFAGLPATDIATLIDETTSEDMLVITQQGGVLYDGVIDGLRALAKHYALYIVSNCQSGYIETFLRANHLGDVFKDISCWGDSGQPKPVNTATIIKRHHLTRPLFIGDTEGDYQAALACDIAFIQAAYGFGAPIADCDKVDSFVELVAHLD
jgi:phosphoglycolate phosphatase